MQISRECSKERHVGAMYGVPLSGRLNKMAEVMVNPRIKKGVVIVDGTRE